MNYMKIPTKEMENTIGSRLPTLLIFVVIPPNVDGCDIRAPRAV